MKNAYSNVINSYVKSIKNELKDELVMLLIIGSSSSNKVIENWSDIDVVLVLENYNFDIIEKIKAITKNFKVKIGTTIFTKKEFINKRIDPKTYYHLYLLQKNEIVLQYIKSNFTIPKIDFNEITQSHIPHLNDKIHFYKRLILYDSLDKSQIKTLFKTTYIIMKTVLILDGYTPKNYEETFNLYFQIYNFEFFEYEIFIKNYIENNDNFINVIEYAKKFILHITENI